MIVFAYFGCFFGKQNGSKRALFANFNCMGLSMEYETLYK